MVDIKEICGEFNKLRELNVNRKFTNKELEVFLKDNLGIGKVIFGYMKSEEFFLTKPRSRRAGGNLYAFTRFPIHLSKFEKVYNIVRDIKNRNNKSSKDPIQEAIALLKKHGYKIKKPVVSYEEV